MDVSEGSVLPTWPPLREPETVAVWNQVLKPLAALIRRQAPDVALTAMGRVRVDAPELFTHPQVFDEVVASTEETLRLFAQLLDLGADPAAAEVPPATLAILRSSVWRHVPLSSNSRVYRMGHEQVWRWLHTQVPLVARSERHRVVAVELVTTMLLQVVDRAMNRAELAYEAEREVWLQGAAASRTAAVDDVLAGRGGDVASLSSRLRYELDRRHVGIVVWAENPGAASTSVTVLGDVVASLGRAVHAESSLTHSLGPSEVAGWFGWRQASEDVTASSLRWPDGVRVAVGTEGRGIDGFRATHTQAVRARTVAGLDGSRTLTAYRDVAVVALCADDPDHAAQFVAATLGALAAPDESTARLATTLGVYLSTNRSRAASASALSVHPNTVSYRVRQAESVLGRSIDVDTLDLGVALRLLPAVRSRLRGGRDVRVVRPWDTAAT